MLPSSPEAAEERSPNRPARRPRLGRRFLLLLLVAAIGLLGVPYEDAAAAPDLDSDGDGFSDAVEMYMGTHPFTACGPNAWPPDFNDDGKVDAADFTKLRAVYGTAAGEPGYNKRMDLNADGRIDIADVVILRSYYGQTCELPATAPPTTFLETFDGDPSTPKLFYNETGWDVAINMGDDPEWMRPMWMQHGPNCEAPPAVHRGEHWSDAVYICRNHLMTAIKQGYGTIYLTPSVLVDFSEGEAVIRFDRSTLVTSNRDWTDIWITPIEDNLMHPLEDWQAFLTGYPRNAIQIKGMENTVVRNFEKSSITTRCCPNSKQLMDKAGLEPSPTRRDTFEIRISRTNISYCFITLDFCRVNNAPIDPPLEWTRGVIQFGHHTYDATKGTVPPGHDCSLAGHSCPDANTWHWDNFLVSPAVPFTMIHSDPRFFRGDGAWHFQSPAPEGAFVRFRAQDDSGNTKISLDNGATWVQAQYQMGSKKALNKSNCTQPCNGNVWHPIPAGTTDVLVKGSGRYSDATIWSLKPPATSLPQLLSTNVDAEEAYVEARQQFGCTLDDPGGAGFASAGVPWSPKTWDDKTIVSQSGVLPGRSWLSSSLAVLRLL